MKIKKYWMILIIMFLVIFFQGCNNSNKQIIFELQEEEVELSVGDTYTPIILIENLNNYELIYDVDSDIITIKNDNIYCIQAGECEVKISIKDHHNVNSVTLKIYIYEVIPDEIICDKEITIFINEEYKLILNFIPENASKEVEYSSNDDNIAVVDDNGIVKGVSEGQTRIVIKSKIAPNVKTRIIVNVIKPPVEKIETVSEIKLNYNETYQIQWNVLPIGSNQEVSFNVSDQNIINVSEIGIVTGIKYGAATIEVASKENNSVIAYIKVIVDGDKATDINVEEETIDLQLGEEYKIKYSVVPSTACQWVEMIVDKEGIEIQNDKICAQKVGTYKITLNTIDNTNISKIIIVNVLGEENPIFVTNNIFDSQSILNWNEDFNALNNIKAFDDKDGDITNKIILKGQVNNRKLGEYVLEYYIIDSDGNETTLIRNVSVVWGYGVTVIGHAGSYYGVPNSEEAILYAAQTLNYPAIEIDLKQTKDGVFVLSHDPVWGNAVLEETNYDELKDVEYTVTKSAGLVGSHLSQKERTFTAKICTFERYLEICKEYNITAIIELKTSSGISNWTEANAPQTSKMPKIMEIIKKYEMLNQVVFLSSQELCLNWVKTNGYEYIPCQYLTLSSCENEKTYNIVKKYNLDISFNVRDGIKISDEWLNKYRELGCKLAVFTFEEYASYSDIQSWINRGVDYVTTDWHVLDELELPIKNNE